MKGLIIILTIFALVSALPNRGPPRPRLDGRIVGGQAIDIQDAPYQVSLLFGGSHICGGSIVSARAALTAAHCTDGATVTFLSIRAGSTFWNTGGTVTPLTQVVQHPAYDAWTIDFDLSILLVQQTLTLGPTIAVVGLPYQNQEFEVGLNSTVSGWGHLFEGGSIVTNLQAVSVPLVSLQECRNAYGQDTVTDQMICAGVPAGGFDACQGDSGGPLVVTGAGGNILVGAVSWGLGCARPGYPGVYSRVASFRGFIATYGWV